MVEGRADADDAAKQACDNCGATLVGSHCHDCGAPCLSDQNLSIRHFAAETFEAVTSVEHGKILRTLAALLFRPGRLSTDYFTGRRIRYLRPLTLTLAVLALHLFAYSVSRTVSMYDIGKSAEAGKAFAEQHRIDPGETVWGRIEARAERLGTPRSRLEKEINEQWARNISLSQIPLILLFALVLQLVLLFSRRFFAEHLVFSMHFIAFQVLVQVLAWPLYYAIGTNLTGRTAPLAIGMFLIDLAYLFLAMRSFYRLGSGKAAIAAPLAFAGYFVIYMGMYVAAMGIAVRSVLAA